MGTPGGRLGDVCRNPQNQKEKVSMNYSMRNCSLASNPMEARQ